MAKTLIAGSKPAVTVLLCCASDDRISLAPALEQLSRESAQVEFVAGLQSGSAGLDRAYEAHGAQGLYVLCRSDSLDRVRTTQLQRLLQNRGVPTDRILNVPLLNESGESVANPVIRWLRSDRMPPAQRSPPPLPRNPELEEPPLEDLWQNSDADKTMPRVPPRPSGPPVRTLGELEKSALPKADGSPGSAAKPLPTHTPPARAAPPPRPAAAPPAAAPPATPQPAAAPPAAAPPTAARPAPAPPAAAPPRAATSPEPPAAVQASNAAPPPMEDDAELQLYEAGAKQKRLMIAGAGAALLLVIGLGFAFASGDDDVPEVAAAEEQAATNEEADESPPQPAPPVDPAPAEPTTDGGTEPSSAETGGEPAPLEVPPQPAVAEPEPIEAPVEEPQADEPEPGETAAEPPEPVADDREALYRALRQRTVRAVDEITFAAKQSRPGRFADAEVYCAELNIDGLTQWRLPTTKELRKLVKFEIIKKLRYWTNEPRKKKQNLFSGGRKRSMPISKRYRGGRALCVRDTDTT